MFGSLDFLLAIFLPDRIKTFIKYSIPTYRSLLSHVLQIPVSISRAKLFAQRYIASTETETSTETTFTSANLRNEARYSKLGTMAIDRSSVNPSRCFLYDIDRYGGRIASVTRPGTITCEKDCNALVVHIATMMADLDKSICEYKFSVWFGVRSDYNNAGRQNKPRYRAHPRYEAIEAHALLIALEAIETMNHAAFGGTISQIVIVTEEREHHSNFHTLIASYFDAHQNHWHKDMKGDRDVWNRLFAKMRTTEYPIVLYQVHSRDALLLMAMALALSFRLPPRSFRHWDIASLPTPECMNILGHRTIDNRVGATGTALTSGFQQVSNAESLSAPATTNGPMAMNEATIQNEARAISTPSTSAMEQVSDAEKLFYKELLMMTYEESMDSEAGAFNTPSTSESMPSRVTAYTAPMFDEAGVMGAPQEDHLEALNDPDWADRNFPNWEGDYTSRGWSLPP